MYVRQCRVAKCRQITSLEEDLDSLWTRRCNSTSSSRALRRRRRTTPLRSSTPGHSSDESCRTSLRTSCAPAFSLPVLTSERLTSDCFFSFGPFNMQALCCLCSGVMIFLMVRPCRKDPTRPPPMLTSFFSPASHDQPGAPDLVGASLWILHGRFHLPCLACNR